MSRTSNWVGSIEVVEADLDYLGHVTAARYLGYFEEARVRWLTGRLGSELPDYVIAVQKLVYRREIRLGDGPLRIEIGLRRMGTSSFDVEETMVGPAGTLHCESSATFVAFDIATRRPRPLTAVERWALEAGREA